jgi:hypothetical protein
MTNTSGICVAFLKAILQGSVKLLASGGDTIMGALYETTATINAGTAAYTATGELTGTGYTATGKALTNANPASTGTGTSGNAAYWTPGGGTIQWTGLTSAAAFDTLLVYDATASNLAMSVHNFGAQNITAGTLTLTLPANAQGTALIELDF